MEDLQAQQRPALPGLGGDLAEGLLGHARIMFEEHPADLATVVEVAHVADEADHRADADVLRMQGVKLLPRIESCLLDADGHGFNLR